MNAKWNKCKIITIESSLTLTLTLTLAFVITACSGGSDMTKIVATETCSLDNVGGSISNVPIIAANSNSEIIFQGWIADTINKKIPKKINLELVNSKNQVEYIQNGNVGIKRPDVATVFNSSELENSGYEIKTNLKEIKLGDYDILLTASYDEIIMICKTNRKLIIK